MSMRFRGADGADIASPWRVLTPSGCKDPLVTLVLYKATFHHLRNTEQQLLAVVVVALRS